MPQIILTTVTTTSQAMLSPVNLAQLADQFDRKMLAAEMYGASVRSAAADEDESMSQIVDDDDEIDHEL